MPTTAGRFTNTTILWRISDAAFTENQSTMVLSSAAAVLATSFISFEEIEGGLLRFDQTYLAGVINTSIAFNASDSATTMRTALGGFPSWAIGAGKTNLSALVFAGCQVSEITCGESSLPF